ncbi:hypothetical protein [Nocardia wallacei]|uniref:hypothetical protein n=1 Tax=Nocardia wallacei TaxID=480035 RepID=UPI0024542948|nr:hypothetical protein [Nocardia wallacei]
MTRSSGDDAASSSIAEHLNWLFDVVGQWIPGPRGELWWRPYSSETVGQAVADATGADPATAAAMIARVRAGGHATEQHLRVIASVFGVPPSYFGDDPSVVAGLRARILAEVLRRSGFVAYRLCRTADTADARFSSQVSNAWPTVRAPILDVDVAPPNFRNPSHIALWNDGPDADSEDESGRPVEQSQSLSVEQLREWCERLVRDLAVPMPLDPYVLCDRLSRQRGRAIKIRAVDLGATTTIGHLVSKRRADLILCDEAAPAPQRTLIICHEVIHLLRHHIGSGESLVCGVDALGGDSTLTEPAGMYSDQREWEAETGARILAEMTLRRRRPDRLVETGHAEHSLAAAFGLRVHRT